MTKNKPKHPQCQLFWRPSTTSPDSHQPLFRRKQQERATVLCRRGTFALRARGEWERGGGTGQVERCYFSPITSIPIPSHPYTTFIPISSVLLYISQDFPLISMLLQSIPYSRSLLSLHGQWNYSFAKGHRRSSSYGSDPATSGLSGTMGEKRGNSFQNLQSRPLSHEEYYCEYSTFYWFPKSIKKCQKESVKQAALSWGVLLSVFFISSQKVPKSVP